MPRPRVRPVLCLLDRQPGCALAALRHACTVVCGCEFAPHLVRKRKKKITVRVCNRFRFLFVIAPRFFTAVVGMHVL